MENDGEEDVTSIANVAKARARVIAGKFKYLQAPPDMDIELYRADRARELSQFLVQYGYDTVSAEWFSWSVDLRTWNQVQYKCTAAPLLEYQVSRALLMFSELVGKAGDFEVFPWIDVEPVCKTTTPEDASTWFNVLKDIIKQQDDLPALERSRLKLPLMKGEPLMVRNTPGITPVEQRQKIWDDIFPGKKYPHGQPFEIIIPSAVRISSDIIYDVVQQEKSLPAAVTVVQVRRVHRRGHFVWAFIVSYAPQVADNRMNRITMALAYQAVLNWARTIIVTGKSLKLSKAFKEFELKLEDEGDAEDTRMRGMGDQMDFTPEQLDLCAEELSLMPWVSVADYAAFRVGEWLNKEVCRTPAEDRHRLLRDWCQLEVGVMDRTNFEGMTREDLQKACYEAWTAKTQEWKETLDVTAWSWTEEVQWAKKLMEPYAV
ncbi:hypothetical protein CORC01_04953 [Colletotrichum orchidophilum]|uniref:Uncharacterized protein n=1 Tax=Colletotrichum orchidophilum TaxID=1209926 RepID=A0A1G4BEP8_9PEZI|nr:uncharacterized protein CORC01_04953 [Colletotrichum orchidophilum]OHE99817.1 hypothetical protein CORC01_04953 [Colletotrichum orchidophilum]